MIKKKEFFIVFLILSFPFSSLVAGSIQPNLPIGMDFNDAEAPHVFKVISTVSDIHFILDEELAGKRIFVTAYDQFAVQAFEVHALDYLLKPCDGDRFFDAIERAKQAVRGADISSLRTRLLKLIAETEIPEMGLKVAIMDAGGDHIELLESTREDSAIGRFLARHGPGIHHVSLEVEDIEGTLAHLKTEGLQLIDETPRVGAQGHRIAFLHPKSTHGVLIELSEAGH